MKITKMHGLGNDFILIEEQQVDYAALAQKLCARRVSVGADGLVVVCGSEEADVRMRIFNADGSEAEMCGNAIRCFARYVYDRGIVNKREMTVSTLAGIMRPQLILEGDRFVGVRVDMGAPLFDAQSIPVLSSSPQNIEIEVAGARYRCASVRMGVPHTIVFVPDIDAVDINTVGPAIERHPIFPQKTNVNFAQNLGGDQLRIETWERGAAHTMACGTGATAAAVIAHRKGLAGKRVEIVLQAGSLIIDLEEHAYMTGAAEYVFSGETCG